ncbi:MAG: GYD domain-containing protein [Chloroflexi bacterium]|nr:GYD domain-containing protein [Chloroflexota bacterium]
MATYVALSTLTDQGVRNMKDLSRRLQNAEQTFSQFGAQLREVYLLLGQYDYVVVAEAPDDETMARIALAIAGQGNVRTQTFRAFDRKEMMRVVEGLP